MPNVETSNPPYPLYNPIICTSLLEARRKHLFGFITSFITVSYSDRRQWSFLNGEGHRKNIDIPFEDLSIALHGLANFILFFHFLTFGNCA